MHLQTVLNQFPNLNSKQWSIMDKNNQIVLVNNYTKDQFIYYKIINNISFVQQLSKTRAQYTIPNTPHIILPKSQIDKNIIEMFVQDAPYKLDRLIKKNENKKNIKYILKNIIQTILFLVNKFGFFNIQYSMIKVTKNYHYLIWIHQNYYSMYRQFPLQPKNIYYGYRIMIYQILSIFQSIGCKKQLQDIRQKLKTIKLISFQKLIMLIQNNQKFEIKQNQKYKKINLYPQFFKKKTVSHFNIQQQSTTTNFSTQQLINSSLIANEIIMKSQISILSNKQPLNIQFFSTNEDTHNNTKIQKNKITKNKNIALSSSINGQLNTSKLINQCKDSKLSIQQMINKNVSQSVEFNDISIKKKDFRQTTSSFTRSRLESSLTSSGKAKFQDFSSTVPVLGNKMMISSVGQGWNRQIKQTFKVKQSKIIEQNSDEVNITASVNRTQKQHNHSLMQLQKDIQQLLENSDNSQQTHWKRSPGLIQLENQLNRILLA